MSYTTYGNVILNTGSGFNGTWTSPNYTYTTLHTNTTATPMTVQQSGQIDLRGEKADININGVSLKETLETIQEMLGVVKTDSALEKEFDELKKVGRQYRQLLKKFREQKEVWETLKKQDL